MRRTVDMFCPDCQKKTPHCYDRMVNGDKVCLICRASDLEEAIHGIMDSFDMIVGDYDFIGEEIEKAGLHE